MNYYRFDIKTLKGLTLKTHFSMREEGGLSWCKRFIREFRKDFPGAELKIAISERERTKKIWEDHGSPYIYKKTLVSKPKNTKDTKGDDHREVEDI